MKRRAYGVLVVAAAMAAVGLGVARAQEATLSQRAAAAVEEFRKVGAPKLGISAVDLRSGQVLLDINAAAPMAPASNQKLLTSAFAIAQLGRSFRFTTGVYSLGNDIFVTGDGDPLLGDPVVAAAAGKTIYDDLDAWVQAIRQTRGTSIRNLVLCISWLSESRRHRDWPAGQRLRWYEAPPAVLNFNDNCFDVTFTVTNGQVQANVQPESRFVRIVNEVQVGRKQAWSGQTNADDSVLTLTGTIVRGGGEPTSIAVNQPPLLLGRTLAERLARAGVTLSGTIYTTPMASVDWTKAERIAQTTTPLAAVLARSNKRSLNMAAECLLLRAGDGTWDRSGALMVRTLGEVYGLDTSGLVVRDGGGLSRGNRVSAAQIAGLLRAVLQRDDGTLLVDSLPISGTDGTMQNRLTEPAYRGRVLGKTGYIAGVSALSGYVLDEAGRPAIAFSILVNNASSARRAKEFQDAVCRILVDCLPAPATQPATP